MNKDFIKIEICGYNIFLLFFRFNHNLENYDKIVLLDLKINREPKVTFSQINLLNCEEHVCNSFVVYHY